MKKFSFLLLLSFSFIFFSACKNESKEKDVQKTAKAEIKPTTTTSKQENTKEYGFNTGKYNLQRDTVQSGESFGSIMDANGIGPEKVYNINEKVKDSFDTRRLSAGKAYIVVKDKEEEKPTAFVYKNDNVNYTVINLQDSITAYRKKLPVTLKQKTISGKIKNSFAQALYEAGAHPNLIHELASLYQWKIDFFRLKKGDEFKVIYNKKYINDSIFAGIADIDAAEFTHADRPYYAFRYIKDEEEGNSNFYDEEAKSLQNFFLKAPVEYTRISSRYSKNRYHPVQKRMKSHLGTDYAAPTGTPIETTADGIVIESAYTQNNGNYVKVKHNSKYTTQYLHMSKRKANKGDRVKQGDVIGFVGQTGLATGPHVCYRFWVNGKQEDPYEQNMPDSEPLEDNFKSDYFESIKPLKEKLDNITTEDESDEETHLAGFSSN